MPSVASAPHGCSLGRCFPGHSSISVACASGSMSPRPSMRRRGRNKARRPFVRSKRRTHRSSPTTGPAADPHHRAPEPDFPAATRSGTAARAAAMTVYRIGRSMSSTTFSTPKLSTRVRQTSVAAAALAGLLVVGGTAQAQGVTSGFELRPFVGAYIPTGDQRDLLKDAVLVGGQLTWHVIPPVAVTGTFGWSPS